MQKHIFVVDDDKAILEVIEIVLKDEGYEVTAIPEYDSLMSSIESKTPDLILLDVSMPGLNGNKISQELKSNDKTKHIPVIIVSAKIDIAEVAIEAKADGYLEKPFEIEQLLEIVKKHATS